MVLLNLGKLLEFLNLKYGDFLGGVLGGGVLLLNHHFGMTSAEVARICPNWAYGSFQMSAPILQETFAFILYIFYSILLYY